MRRNQLITTLAGLLACLFCCTVAHAGAALDTANAAIEKSKSYNRVITLPIESEQAKAAAQGTFNAVQAPEFQERLSKETDRVGREVMGINTKDADAFKSYYSNNKSPLAPDERIYVFISTSVPIDTL